MVRILEEYAVRFQSGITTKTLPLNLARQITYKNTDTVIVRRITTITDWENL